MFFVKLCQVLHVDKTAHLVIEYHVQHPNSHKFDLLVFDGIGVGVFDLIDQLSGGLVVGDLEGSGLRLLLVSTLLTLLLHLDYIEETYVAVTRGLGTS